MKKMRGLLIRSILCILFFGASSANCEAVETARSYATSEVEIHLREDIVFLTATELAKKIRSRELTSVEVVDAFLNQIDAFNSKLNALVSVNNKQAREQAKQADEALAKGEIWGPLHGVPVTIKDHIATKGLRTTSGYPPLRNYVPDFDAPVVDRLKKAGAILLGKSNLPPLGADVQTHNPLFGTTNNPWDLERTPGGSSGGEAAAIAAGLSPLGIGTDIGGSIRIPAHFTGIFGLKPTENIVAKTGVNPGLGAELGIEFNSLRHRLSIGPLARSIDDLKLVYSIIAGADWRDADVPDIPVMYPKPKPINQLKIAWIDHFGNIPVSSDIHHAMERFVNKLREKGVVVEKTALSDFGVDYNQACAAYAELGDMELGIRMPSYVRLFQYIFRLKKDMVFPLSYEKYLKLLTDRDNLISRMEQSLSRFDGLLVPVTSTPAYKHIEPARRFGPSAIYKQKIDVDSIPVDYWAASSGHTKIFNVLGNPVITMPIGFSGNHLPLGIQLVGARWQDARLLVLAGQLFDAAGCYRTPEGYGKPSGRRD